MRILKIIMLIMTMSCFFFIQNSNAYSHEDGQAKHQKHRKKQHHSKKKKQVDVLKKQMLAEAKAAKVKERNKKRRLKIILTVLGVSALIWFMRDEIFSIFSNFQTSSIQTTQSEANTSRISNVQPRNHYGSASTREHHDGRLPREYT